MNKRRRKSTPHILVYLLPLTVFVMALLVMRLTGSCWQPENTTQTTAATGTAATSQSAATTAATTTASPVTTVSTSQTGTLPSESTAETSATTAEPTSGTTGVNPDSLSNAKQGWYYNPPDPLNQEKPAAIPAAVQKLISNYDVIWQKPLAGRKVVYLTMDEGYEYQNNTEQILNTAKLKGVPITFFITGSYLDKNPDKVQRMLEEGHLVANHTVNHPNLVTLAETDGGAAVIRELDDLAAEFRVQTGQDMPRLVRPPEGGYSERVLAYLTREGYRTVFWSFAYRDWLTDDQPDPQAAREKIIGQLHDGSVILLHAVSATNVQILPGLIDEIRSRGYDFALLDEIP